MVQIFTEALMSAPQTRSAAPRTGSAAPTGGTFACYRWRGWDTRGGRAIREDRTPVYGLGMHGTREMGAVRRLARLLARVQADVVHLHLYRATLYGGVAARLARVPVV